MSEPLASILAAPGTNRDPDLRFALELAGFTVQRLDVRRLAVGDVRDSSVIVVAGGFSYADALGAGRLFALELQHAVGDALRGAVERGTPVLGICNGFQVLVRLGLLPGHGRRVALGHNESGKFECGWVRLSAPESRCVWTRGLDDGIDCPIAHGEGRFVCDDDTWRALTENGQIALRYASPNPNGSRDDIAGICDPTGLVLGLMPHPENHVLARQHPRYRAPRTSNVRSDARVPACGHAEPARLGLDLLRNGRLHALA